MHDSTRADRKKVAQNINELLIGIKNGRHEDFDVLRGMYSPLIDSMAASFEASGAGSRAELEQEAESALLRAALSYDEKKKDVTFGLYAKVCVRNALVSVRRAKLSRERRSSAANRTAARRSARKRMPVDADAADEIIERMSTELSAYEKSVLREYIAGADIRQIAEKLGKSTRSINNCLYRARRKLKQAAGKAKS